MGGYKIFKRLGLFLVLIPLFSSLCAADLEQQLKAVYLGRLLSYVTWSPSVELENSQSFNLCLLGTASFSQFLASLYNQKFIKSKPINIRYFDKVERVSNCHLLFVGISEQAKITQILNFTHNKPILTISETRGFADKGGIIQFLMKDQKVNMKINSKAYEALDFEISSDLLGLSTVDVINR